MNKVLEAIELLSQVKGNCDCCEISSDLLMAAKRELEVGLRDLETQREAMRYEMEMKQKALDAQTQLFNMKWSMLEEETRKLAEDSKKAEKRRAFFERVNSYQKNDDMDNLVHGEMFFKGANSPQALKKRYKDLIKIYHPDSEFGDNHTVQEINREYDNLRRAMAK